MHSSVHTESSAKIFGGKPEDYREIHNLIDQNKKVHASVTGRFFMHHYDVGGSILEHLFGDKFINSSAVVVVTKDVLMQHLIEDYGQVPMFLDWLSLMYRNKPEALIDMTRSLHSVEDAFSALERKHLVPKDRRNEMFSLLLQIRKTVSLESFTEDSAILMYPFSSCIFMHYTGLDLLRTMLKTKDQVADDFLLHGLGSLTNSPDDVLDPKIPVLTDWMEVVKERPWMRRPEGMERHDTEFVRAKMEDIKAGGKEALGVKTGKEEKWDFGFEGNDPSKCSGGRYD